MAQEGKTIVFTGNGKGKTTSALGLGFEGWLKGKKVLVLQFLKGERSYGEHHAIGSLDDNYQIKQMGLGFIRNADEKTLELHKLQAKKALEESIKEILSGRYDIIVLDEINYAIHFGLLTEDEVLPALKKKPADLMLILTGRYARDKIIEQADEAYELIDVKHHSSQGMKAVRGIEF